MADFCKQCSEEIFGEDFKDLENLGPKCPEGMGYQVLCEGCGSTFVDHTGKCIWSGCLKKHGDEK